MGSFALAMIVTFAIGIVCLYVTLKSSDVSPVFWVFETCGENNGPDITACASCGMIKEAYIKR